MLKTERRTIAGQKYDITQLPSEVGMRMFVRLSQILGPALGAAFKTLKPEDVVSLNGLGIQGIGELVISLSQRVSPDELVSICDTFMEHTQVETDKGGWIPLKDIKYLAWSGKYGAMFKWLQACIEVNYGNFLEELGITSPQT